MSHLNENKTKLLEIWFNQVFYDYVRENKLLGDNLWNALRNFLSSKENFYLIIILNFNFKKMCFKECVLTIIVFVFYVPPSNIDEHVFFKHDKM